METMHNSSQTQPGNRKKIMIVEDQFIEAHDLQLMLQRAQYEVCGIARSFDEAMALLDEHSPELVLLDIFLKGKRSGIDLAKILMERSIGFIFVSANSSRKILDEAKATQPYGFIVKPFREQDVLITLEIAFYRRDYSQESQTQQQVNIQNSLSAIDQNENSPIDYFTRLAKALQTYLPFDYLEAGFSDAAEYDRIGLLRKKMDDYQVISPGNLAQIAEIPLEDLQRFHLESVQDSIAGVYSNENLQKLYSDSGVKRVIIQSFGIKSVLIYPFPIDGRPYNLSFYSRQPDIQNASHISLLRNVEPILNSFLKKIPIAQTIETGTPAKTDPDDPSKDSTALEGIVGSSQKLLQVFDRIKRVAPSDTSVLILGESGTGKERIAEAIHKMSPRSERPFVVIDCSTVPQNLAESLLFGHEKGSFSGATERRIGKFESASGGTIFLDEIGELPIELQVKLLRVLQQKEIERVGGNCKIKVDVRIIAATNRQLEEEVAAGRFRMDLYYRLHVFPITVPPLRERKEDIPELLNHFITLHGTGLGKQNAFFSKTALAHLLDYDWDGNIRELEHVVQRSLLLSNDLQIVDADLPVKSHPKKMQVEEYPIKTIIENERDYIIYILQKCKGKITGANGAAELLDIHPSTLNSRMKKLGIKTHLFS